MEDHEKITKIMERNDDIYVVASVNTLTLQRIKRQDITSISLKYYNGKYSIVIERYVEQIGRVVTSTSQIDSVFLSYTEACEHFIQVIEGEA